MIDIQVDLVTNDLVPDRGEAGTKTWPPNTKTVINPEQGAVHATLYKLFAGIKKLEWLPVQIDARMWATVDITEYLRLVIHEKTLYWFTMHQYFTFIAG